MKLREAVDEVMANPCRRALKINLSTDGGDFRLLFYDPSYDDTGFMLRPALEGCASGVGFGAGIFSLDDLLSDAHEVVDIAETPFRMQVDG